MADRIENGNTTIFQVFENLTYGELSQYTISGADGDEISEGKYPKIMSIINRGINKIQEDLSIHENTVRLKLIEGVFTYPIHSKHSLVNGSDPVKFVDDDDEAPFEDDILRIRQIYNKGGTELPINVRNRADSLFVPQHNVIQHPFVKDGDILGVVYSRRTKPLVVTTVEEAKTTYLPIPDYTLDALYAYVASKMTAGITTNQEISDSQVWLNEYERLINQMKDNPRIPAPETVNTKLTDNHFV